MENINQNTPKERRLDLWVSFMAEFLATGAFVFMVCGSTLSWPSSSPFVLHTALTVGLSIATLASSIDHITGGQINPVVTLGFVLTRRLPPLKGIFIISAQFLGGIVGASLLYAFTPRDVRKSVGITVPAANVNLGQAVGMEAFLTFVLVFTIYSVTDPNKPKGSEYGAPVIIGFCVFICHMIGIPFTGCGLNPARSFAPALINNSWTYHWVYWVGPIIGAITAAFLYHMVFSVKNNRITPDASSRRQDEGL